MSSAKIVRPGEKQRDKEVFHIMASLFVLSRPVILLVLQWLEPLDLIHVSGVCRVLRELSLQDSWKRFEYYGVRQGGWEKGLFLSAWWDDNSPHHFKLSNVVSQLETASCTSTTWLWRALQRFRAY